MDRVARRNDNYVDAYSNSDSVRPKRRTSDGYNGEKYGTRVFEDDKPTKKRRSVKAPAKKTSLTAVNVALAIMIVALLVCLVALLGIYTTLNA